MLPHWHIIWTVHGAGLPQSANTSWAPLTDLYARLAQQGLSPVLCDAIVEPVSARSASPHVAEIPADAARTLRRDILDLVAPQGDRVAGGLGLEALLIGRTHVELLLQHPFDELHQKLSRLKSRTATLLSLRTNDAFGGKGTWSKGFWVAQIAKTQAADAIRGDLNERLQKISDPTP